MLPTVRSESERLGVARQMMERRQWTLAADLLKTYVANNPGGASVDEAVYRLGECYLALKDWPAATVEFERLLRDYPESDSSGSAAMRLGDALFGQARPADFDQDFTQKALDQWRGYLRDYPGHWLNAEAERKVDQARHRLAGKLLDTAHLYVKLGLKSPARIYFQRVVDDYEDLDVAADALFGLAEIESAEGHKDAAIQNLHRIEERFPGQPSAGGAARLRAQLERELAHNER
jgi:outer membrane assembly lipoprotein YfiO